VTSYLNTTTSPVYDVRLGLTAHATDDRAARMVRPLDGARFPVVQPGETVSTKWQVDVPLSAATGTHHLVGRAAYQRSPGATQPIFETGGLTRATLGPALDAALDPTSSVSTPATHKTPSSRSPTRRTAGHDRLAPCPTSQHQPGLYAQPGRRHAHCPGRRHRLGDPDGRGGL
jgi:hypothetical protein